MKFPLLLSVTFLLLLGSRPVWSQTNGEVAVIGRAQPGKILLRWAPTKSAGWVYANQYGYTLERITMFRNGEAVVPVERVVLGISRPAPEAEWEPLIENDYAAVAAQALYGETFELSQNYDEDIMQIVNKAQEQDQRWSFALFAADQDYQVAQMCGLAFTDEGVRPGEQYLYQVYANIPPLIYPLDTGSVYISLEDYAPLPQPREVSGVFGDGAVLLRWNRVFFEETYNSFIIERSEDGGQSFYEISEDPLVNAYVEENPNARYYYKLDSIENGKNYAYRIRGLTSFGEKGPPSDTIRGVGVPTIETRAQITGHEILPNGAVALSWAFDKPTEVLIDGFVVERSPQANGPFVPVSPLLGKSTRFYQDDAAMGATYYRVSLKADDNVVNPGFPYLVQPEDSIPPAIPVDLTYTLDSAGAFALTWAQNTEPDLQGYRIYQSNFENSEFVQITQEPVSQAQWLDSLNLKTLTRTQYYQVAAVDVHNNTSDRSAILRVEKPDVVPPIRPVFQPPTADSLGIHLQWVASVSTDVVSHTLYRRGPRDAGWVVIASLGRQDSAYYLDAAAEPYQPYRYTLVAKDSAGLESPPAIPVVSQYNYSPPLDFGRISHRVDREAQEITIQWRWEHPQSLEEVRVYRAKAGESLTLYQTLTNGEIEFIDRQIALDTQYTYRVKGVLPNGQFSNWSEPIQIAY